MIRPSRPDRTFRPWDADINWHHPLVTNLRLCAVFDSLRAVDRVLNRMLITSTEPNPASSWSAGQRGPSGSTSAPSQFWHYGNEGTAVRLPTTMCTGAILRQPSTTVIRDAAMFTTAPTAGTRLMLSTFTDNNFYWDFGGTSSPNRISGSAVGKVTLDLEAWVAVAGYRGSAVYRNGLRIASQTTAITRTAGTSQVRVAAAGNATSGDPGQTFLFLLLETEWTPTQVAEWTAEPFAIFRRTRSRVWPTAVAGGAVSPVGAARYHYQQLQVA